MRPKVQTGWLGITSAKGVRTELIGKLWSGHVFRVVEDQGQRVTSIAGNERNRVNVGSYSKAKVVAFIAPR